MEEDIEILEKMKEESLRASECSLTSGSERKEWKREAQAIENLIKGYKELEQENKTLKFENQELKGSLIRKIGFEHQSIFNEIKENSIPKSVIKNKIQQVENKIKVRCSLIERMSGRSLEEMIEDIKIYAEYEMLKKLLKENNNESYTKTNNI